MHQFWQIFLQLKSILSLKELVNYELVLYLNQRNGKTFINYGLKNMLILYMCLDALFVEYKWIAV